MADLSSPSGSSPELDLQCWNILRNYAENNTLRLPEVEQLLLDVFQNSIYEYIDSKWRPYLGRIVAVEPDTDDHCPIISEILEEEESLTLALAAFPLSMHSSQVVPMDLDLDTVSKSNDIAPQTESASSSRSTLTHSSETPQSNLTSVQPLAKTRLTLKEFRARKREVGLQTALNSESDVLPPLELPCRYSLSYLAFILTTVLSESDIPPQTVFNSEADIPSPLDHKYSLPFPYIYFIQLHTNHCTRTSFI